MLLSPNDPRRSLFLTVPRMTGAMELKKNAHNASGFDRVGKHGKKWRAWTTVDGKQTFLSDHADPEDAAKELWNYENADKPNLRSPSPGHRHNAKRAPPACAYPSLLKLHTHRARHLVFSQGCQWARCRSPPARRSPRLLATTNTPPGRPKPWWDETFVGDRYFPLVYADELLTPLPGVPFLAYKHVE